LKRVLRLDSVAEIAIVRGLLEHAGIPCIVKNEQLAGALGEIPFLECQPELCVLDDADEGRAEAVIARHFAPAEAHRDWVCTHCGEANEGQFSACWRCAAVDTQP
jgi:hypothetical protein